MNDLAYQLDQMQRAIAQLWALKADMEARAERMFRKGAVTDVDPENHLYRQEIGLDDEGQPVKSPWLPYSQQAGARKTHSPPSVGEQYLLINPDGSPDFTQGLGVPHGWSDANPSPSTDGKADVVTRGNTKDTTTETSRTLVSGNSTIDMRDGAIKLSVGGVSLTFTPAGAAFQSGEVSHDQHDIGVTHVHTGVTPGGGDTGPPA